MPERASPATVMASMNTILHERQLEEYYCTLCYAVFDFKRRTVIMANSGLPYPVRASGDLVSQIELPGVPLGSFAGSSYDEATFDLAPGDVYVFSTDGVSEARDPAGREFGTTRLLDVVAANRRKSSQDLVHAIFAALREFVADAPTHDDMTAVVVKITA
jgi:sigma-B regulation protein RsbU (phosphoserine phosphatase)